jgi:hypothetical protein
MKTRILTLLLLMLGFLSVHGQLIQGTLKPGPASNQVEVWLKPDFDNLNARYLFQIGLPIAWSATAPIQPTDIAWAIDPGFTATFGNNYTVTKNPIATNTGGTEKYINLVLVRGGAGASAAQSWTHDVEFKVLTVTFNSPNGSPGAPVKLADYQDGGSDGQGNFYTQNEINGYYVSSNSISNFYASTGSTVAGTASAGYVVTNANITLPVRLLSFSGYKNGNKNILQWSTSDEANCKGFEIQRSQDGENFSRVGFVNTLAINGNSSSVLKYSFEDYNPILLKQFYRLKQIDIDEKAKMSNVVMISGAKPAIREIGGLYPNPTHNILNVIVNSPQNDRIDLIVTELGGKIVRNKLVTVGEGSNSIDIDISSLPANGYLITIKGEKNMKGLKFIKQ